MDQGTIDVVAHISNLLDVGKYKEAVSAPHDDKFADSFKDNCWDLTSLVIKKIQDDTIVIKPSLYGACEELLNTIIEKSTPEEALLEFIEQIELAKNDAQFGLILGPLQLLLKKLSIKRGRSLEWCLNSISTYIENIPTPEYQLEGKERLLMDCEPNIRRVARVYSLLPTFYKPFIHEINIDSNTTTKQIITAFLISLMGKPLIYVDMDPDIHSESETKLSCNAMIKDICVLEKNVLKFLCYLEKSNKENKSPKNVNGKGNSDDSFSPYDSKDKINMTTLSGLFYVIFSKHFEIPDSAIPQVYSLKYLIHTLMLATNHLFSFTEYGPLAKGIQLLKVLLNYLNFHTSHNYLSFSVHFDVCKSLVNIAIYSNYDTIRKNAVSLIGCHVNKFDYKGRCTLIRYLLDVSNHSGMIGYAITLYKNAIDEAMKESTLSDCFIGPQLLNMIKKICYLPYGAESDLIELADQIISALNFLRYLALKDTANVTGIRQCFTTIEIDYLDKLRFGLNMSKAHYEVALKDLQDGKKLPEEKDKISINVGGNILDNIPVEKKKEIIISALNAFHLIEGLIARLSECINTNKMQGLNTDSLRIGHRNITPLVVGPVNNLQKIVRNYCNQNVHKEVTASASTTDHEERQYEENIKSRILEKALEFVTKTGWSVESLSSGAKAAGYPSITHGLFPNGGGDLVHYFNIRCNEQLVTEMKSWPIEDIRDSKVPVKFIENAIMTRLLMIEPYKSTWPKAMAIQTLPNNVPNCLATLLSLVDDICYHSGDRSVDFNWYMRRVGLAGIYKAAELFYLTDSTQGSSATRSFVNSRIRDAQLIQSALNMNPVSAAPQTLTAAFVTAKNILGINTLK